MNERTKKFKILTLITELLSILLTLGPLGYFLLNSFLFTGINTSQRLILVSGTVVCIVLTLLNIILKVFKYSRMWILLICLTLVIPKISTLIIVMGICTIIDEIIISPLHNHFKTKYKINREIDLR